MELSRRKMVTATTLTLLTAGCSSSATDPKLILESSITAPPSDPLTLDVETRQSEITDYDAGKLNVTYHNTRDEPVTLTLAVGEPHPKTSKSESPGVALENPEETIEKEQDGLWMPAADSVSSTLGRPEHELGPDDDVTVEYQVWAHPQGKPEHSGLEPGTYRVPMPESAVLGIGLTEP